MKAASTGPSPKFSMRMERCLLRAKACLLKSVPGSQKRLLQLRQPIDDGRFKKDTMIGPPMIGGRVNRRDLLAACRLNGLHQRIGSRRQAVIGGENQQRRVR